MTGFSKKRKKINLKKVERKIEKIKANEGNEDQKNNVNTTEAVTENFHDSVKTKKHDYDQCEPVQLPDEAILKTLIMVTEVKFDENKEYFFDERSTKFICSVCQKIYDSKSSCYEHYLYHIDRTPYTCNICNVNFQLKQAICEHIIVHFNKRNVAKDKILAPHLGKNAKLSIDAITTPYFSLASSIELHLIENIHFSRAHNQTHPFKCAVENCTRQCKSFTQLKKHRYDHSPATPHVCNYCNESYKSFTSLFLHVRYKHKFDAYEYINRQCRFCLTQYERETYAQRCLLRHDGCDYYSCDLCHKRFRNRKELRKHLITHSNMMLKCDVCSRIFKNEKQLRRHTREYHERPDEQKFRCETCNKLLPNLTRYHEHSRSHVGFLCHICGKASKCVRAHMRSHEAKQHTCNICAKTFRLNKDLIHHRLSHTQENVYVCEYCPKSFTKSCSLRLHLRVHLKKDNANLKEGEESEERPFGCCMCTKKFSTHKSLEKHVKTHERLTKKDF